MNETVKQIEELKRQISYIEFQDYLSSDDYVRIARLNKQIRSLEEQLKGLTGIVVHVTYKDTKHFGTNGWYLTDNESLCCSDEPVLFESLEEAKAYLEKAHLNSERYNVEFVEATL
jgi:hypothetical protein